MHKNQLADEFSYHPSKEQVKYKAKLSKELDSKIKQNQLQALNSSQIKHMHAIRPYNINNLNTKERKNSKRQSRVTHSPYEMSRSKSKKFQQSSRKIEQSVSNKYLSQIYAELASLRAQYKNMEHLNYNLIKQKEQVLLKKQEQTNQLEKANKELEKYKKNVIFLEKEIERIKKECYKILETEKFKNKKLQETIEEKDLMIAFLRNELGAKKGEGSLIASTNQQNSLFFLQNSAPIFNYDYLSRESANLSLMSNVIIEPEGKQKHKRSDVLYEEDSLSFSRDKSRDMESVHSLLTNNNDITHITFTKKDVIILSSKHSELSEDQCPTFEVRPPQENQSIIRPSAIKKIAKSKRDHYQKDTETITVINKNSLKEKHNKINTKRLQILTNDQNTQGNQQASLQTKKKGLSSSGVSSKQKKKVLTSKKKK